MVEWQTRMAQTHVARKSRESSSLSQRTEREKKMGNVKQVIVIRKDLKMRRGKEIAQGAHASIAFLTSHLSKLGGASKLHPQDEKLFACAFITQAESEWIQGNFRKICCIVNSEEELLALVGKAKAAQVTCELIQDSGLTEFGGTPTYTAAAFGPDYDENLDPITGELVLY